MRDDGRRAGGSVSRLLRRSDLSGPVAAAVAATLALTWTLPFAAAVVLLAPWAPVRWAAGGLVALWLAGAGMISAVVLGAWSALLGVVLACGGIALLGQGAGPALAGGVLLALGAGVVAGGAVRFRMDRRERARRERLAALPDWERDELGGAAALYDPAARREAGAPAFAPEGSGPAAGMLAAVCRPLPGAEVLPGARLPWLVDVPGAAVAVHGTRAALLLPPGPAEVPPVPELPAGASLAVFVLDDGTSPVDPAAGVSAPGAGRVRPVTPHDPGELAAFLLDGAPADGDALHGVAADVHVRLRRALAG
ncbi:hypothetical protein [Corynebacterium sp. 335C]